MNKVKISILSIVFMFFWGTINTSAAEQTENINVSTEPPIVEDEVLNGEITPFGLNKPGAGAYIDLRYQKMNVSGSAQASTLYTNNHFKGKTLVHMDLWNHTNRTLTVKIYKRGSLIAHKTITISPNSGVYTPISGLNANDLYYAAFYAPSNFSGSFQ
ncbi:hypothetical protein [Cytobacillus purgationiresistens]|uniref:Uncharacterized protein n=1 Tax=Cytobacillus purgationiresistens TaxID=863449 RepID=A0ABU0AKT1_9BACI|nr:hypothetical protein [Cytobacillus purgationiresistens]MDQ0271876.1 hypothetical protein [Cytobacillus purgationiresistens]